MSDEQNPKRSHWLAAAADVRGNLVRMIAILGFYSIHLMNTYWPAVSQSSPSGEGKALFVSDTVHLYVSILAFAWLMQALGVHLASLTRPFSHRIALLVVFGDVIWLTAALCFSTGAVGPMVAGYFLIIGLAALRLDLWLIRWATVASTFGYVFVLGATRWPVGLLKKVEIGSVPRYHQVMTIVALILMGVVVAQVVRLGWGMVASHQTASTDSGVAGDE